MHILSELRNPLFDTPDRQRAIRALQISQVLKEKNDTKAWAVVKGMIDKVVGEQFISQSTRAEASASSSAYPSPTTASMNNPIASTQMPIYTERALPYAYQRTPGAYGTPIAQHPRQRPPQPYHESQFSWDDVNLNNVVGNVPQQQNPELPEFDWVRQAKYRFKFFF